MQKSDYFRLRADNVNEKVSIFKVLQMYGVPTRTEDREVQYPCPLHGDGRDRSFSARAYPHSNSTFCFACHKARDPIEWVRDKENLGFMDAVRQLEEKFGIDPPKPPADLFEDGEVPESVGDRYGDEVMAQIAFARAGMQSGIENPFKRVDRRVRSVIRDRAVELDQAVKLCHVIDSLRFNVDRERIAQEDAVQILIEVNHKIDGMV